MICKWPCFIWSWKWWYFNDMCFVLGLKVDSVVAKIMHAMLSLYTLDGGRECDGFVWPGCCCWRLIKLTAFISSRIHRNGKRCRVAVERAMHSLSVVESVISVCSLLHHVIRQPQNVITKPLLDKTFSLSLAYSSCHIPAIFASMYTSIVRDCDGLKIKPYLWSLINIIWCA